LVQIFSSAPFSNTVNHHSSHSVKIKFHTRMQKGKFLNVEYNALLSSVNDCNTTKSILYHCQHHFIVAFAMQFMTRSAKHCVCFCNYKFVKLHSLYMSITVYLHSYSLSPQLQSISTRRTASKAKICLVLFKALDSADGDNMLQNIGNYLPGITLSYPTRTESLATPVWEPQILQSDS
jgi:hypothetical protein